MGRRGPTADHQARYDVGALEQRVYGLEQAIGGIAQQIGALSQKIDARGQTNWSVLTGFGVLTISILGLLGNQALSPIRDNQTDLKASTIETNKAVAALANQTAFQFNQIGEKYVSIRELEGRSGRTRQEIDRLNTDLTAQEANIRRSMEQADAHLQRQVDDQKKSFGETYSLRDAMQQYRRELDDLRTRVTQR